MKLSEIPDEACEALMKAVRTGCPDGGLILCYDCTRKAIQKVVSTLDIHAHCFSLPNFTIDKTAQTGTNAGLTFTTDSPCADGDFCKRVNGRIKHDQFCDAINHKDED